MWLKAIANPEQRVGLAMDLNEDKRAQSDTPVAFSVRNPATLGLLICVRR
jgi:hypothetical protein